MFRNRGSVITSGLDQFAAAQKLERGLHGAFREAGRFRERAQTSGDGFPFRAGCLAVEMEINQIRGRLAIVADDVAHQDVEDVVVDRDSFTESCHSV